LFQWSEIPNGAFNSWIKIKIDLDVENSMISVSFNGYKKQKIVKGLSTLHDFDIIFGACTYPNFLNTDVPPMTLKNIVVYKPNHEVYRYWKLSKHSTNNNEVYDEIAAAKAVVYNGRWIADKHFRWEKLKTLKVDGLVGIAKNANDGIFYLIGRKYLLAYSIPKKEIDTIYYAKGYPLNVYYDYFIYNNFKRQIWSYDISSNEINVFDFRNRTWSQSDFNYKEPDLAYNNKIISPIDSNLIIFGGYGHYKYKAQFHIYNQLNATWKTLDASKNIFPRYLASSGLTENNQWLIFGGYGSQSGTQEISPRFYYDLYSVDLKSYHVKKLLTYKTPDIPFVPCEALVKIPNSNCFYTLLYNPNNFTTYLRLALFRTDKPEYVLYPDSIPYNFSDVESWCTFFLHKKTSQLFAITVHKSDAVVYSMAYPPLLKSEVIQPVIPSISWIFWVIVIVICSCLICVVLLYLKKRETKKKVMVVEQPWLNDNDDQKIPSFNIPIRKSKSSIYFLGGFQIYDKTGNNITAEFTPTLKQLFIIVFLYTFKTGKGISTAKLNEILWFDKTDNSARNNRNVSISKLRSLLDKIGEIDLKQENAYWIIHTENVYSDFIEITLMNDKLKSYSIVPTESEILRFVQVAFSGELLPDLQIDWVDEFKADFSNSVIDTLSGFISLTDIKDNDYLLYYIADCMLKYDTINDDAISLKCAILYRQGKNGLAKNTYDSFVREYQNLLGSTYSIPFNDLIRLKY
jgi:DNA-binding SARP family transcriptional activator